MYRGVRVAVVIPAYNEELLIGPTVRSVPAWVDAVVVVDDRSRDGTALAVRRLVSERVSALHLERNAGVGGAILAGYRHAVERGADVVAVMAGDGQMDPADLPSLLDPIVDGEADYVKGNRLGAPELLDVMPPVRVVGNFALSALTRVVTGYRDVLDSQCGYTALTADAVRRLEGARIYPRYGFPNALLTHLAVIGARVVDRPVRPVYGRERSGIRWPLALFTIGLLLLRCWSWRLWKMYVAPALGRGPLPSSAPSALRLVPDGEGAAGSAPPPLAGGARE